MIPARGQAFVLDAELLGAILFERVERNVVEDREVFRRVVRANARLVLVHRHIQDPVEAVLNGPVAAHHVGQVGGVRRQARDEEAGLARGRGGADGALGLDQDRRTQARPMVAVGQPVQVLGGPGLSDFDESPWAVAHALTL